MHWVRAAFRRTLNRLDDITDYRTSLVGPKADLTIGTNDVSFHLDTVAKVESCVSGNF